MLQSLAKVAVRLRIDDAANRLVERLYSNQRTVSRFSRRFQVLAYHKVSPDPHPFFEPVEPQAFEEQMQFISSCYRVMALTELIERSRRGEVLERAVAVTFDDGYRDNYEYAFPILKKYKIPATIFVATGAIETGATLWHDRVFDAFRYTTVEHGSLPYPEVGTLLLEPPTACQDSLRRVLYCAKKLYGDNRRRFIDEVELALKPILPRPKENRMLTWNQIRDMHAMGIEFGSHTVTHPILSQLPAEEALKELVDSKAELTHRLKSSIASFAYPNGQPADYNEGIKALLRRAGYTCAVTTTPGFNHVFSDPFEIRRGQPFHKQIELFRLAFFLERHGLN
jgi:peptidoglycan/xylan/chitin deacetylase (PgdA/CDA1 family)